MEIHQYYLSSETLHNINCNQLNVDIEPIQISSKEALKTDDLRDIFFRAQSYFSNKKTIGRIKDIIKKSDQYVNVGELKKQSHDLSNDNKALKRCIFEYPVTKIKSLEFIPGQPFHKTIIKIHKYYFSSETLHNINYGQLNVDIEPIEISSKEALETDDLRDIFFRAQSYFCNKRLIGRIKDIIKEADQYINVANLKKQSDDLSNENEGLRRCIFKYPVRKIKSSELIPGQSFYTIYSLISLKRG